MNPHLQSIVSFPSASPLRIAIALGVCACVLVVEVGRTAESASIRTLTVEDARKLAQDRSGRLLLDDLTTLTQDSARELARHEGWLSLNGLRTLSPEAATALAQHKGYLHLDGLKAITDDVARALAGHAGELSLNGVTSISDEAARALAQHRGGRLSLKGLTTLSTEAVKALAQRKGGGPTFGIRLDGLTALSAEAAAVLAEVHPHGWDGRLPGFKSVPEDVAAALAKRQHGLTLEGLTTLSEGSAKALGGKLGGRLPRLTSLTVETARAIAGPVPGQFHRTLILDGLTALPDDVALAIGGKDSRGDLHLNGLTALTPIAAKAICQREGDLHLNGLKTISDETLKALAEHKAHAQLARPVVFLKGLTALSDDGAAILAAWPKWCGELPALPVLSEKAAIAVAASRNWDGALPAVVTLPLETARALAQRNGNLALDGMTSLTDAAASALAGNRGGTLFLNGLKQLSEPAATALAAREGRLSLTGLATLSSGAAHALSAHKGDWLFLDGLPALPAAAAKSLAQHRGAVSLRGLTTLTDDALKALKGNPRIVHSEKFRTAVVAVNAVSADAKFVRSFLDSHCANCHDAGEKEGDFELSRLAQDNVAGRVAYASILERLRAGDMPPAKKPRPGAPEAGAVMNWIAAQLDTPLPGKPAYFAVNERPIDGNRLPNAILFGGPRGPGVPPPPRLWRVSPAAYGKWLGEFKAHGLQQPFGVIQEAGFKDFAALYAPDEGASGLLLSNAEQIVEAQTRSKGGVFGPLLNPTARPTKEELTKALTAQYLMAVARPPGEKELASLLALYEDVAREGDLPLAGKTILMAPLIVPEAILRFEVGLGAEVRSGVRMLSPRETAFALSLALSSKRDNGLLAAAAAGGLRTRAEVTDSVRRILDDPKLGKSRVLWFFREYFDYHRAPEVFKDPLPNHLQRRGIGHNAQGYVADTDILVLQILARDRDVLKELLTTTEAYRSHELFHIGNAFNDGPDSPVFRHLPPVARENRREQQDSAIGIVMQPSWLVAWSGNFHNDIVRRGRWVREHLLGGRVPDLPINVAAMIPDDPHRTLRQRQMVTREVACWKCHNKMDELGLPFENDDHYARARRGETVLDLAASANSKDKEGKVYREVPLDTTGVIAFSGDPKLDGPVRDAPEMLRRLAESDRVRQIFIRHAFRYFMGRNETPGDAVSLQEAEKAYLDNGGSFKALLASLLSSESFLYRTAPTEGAKK